MKAHKYWSLGALAAMIGTFYTGYKNMKTAHKYFACSSLSLLFFLLDLMLLRWNYSNYQEQQLPYYFLITLHKYDFRKIMLT